MVPGRVEGESQDVIRVDGVSDEAASGMGVKGDHEEKCGVMGVPGRLRALAMDVVVGGSVRGEHGGQHEVASDVTGSFVVDILSGNLTDLCIGC